MTEESQWTTFYGRTIKVVELSHQHLSNILWYFDLVLEMGDVLPIRTELEKRFGGIQLPYHPNLAHKSEIDILVIKGYTKNELEAPIIIKGKWVGSLKYA